MTVETTQTETIGSLIDTSAAAWQKADVAQTKVIAAFKLADKTNDTLSLAHEWYNNPIGHTDWDTDEALQDIDDAHYADSVATKQANIALLEANAAFKRADKCFSKLTRAFRSAETEISKLRLRRKLLTQTMRDVYESS